ncbi:type IV pilus secretin PilQ family protein [Motilimonas cestriensis]|uniref:Type IV pilus secretin PilQ family protein n=1 Tax=Motilimonas cestriensis TaxID=2742685 RepID=A0ABS8W9U8_9GAMM|nr:type IV pilus secretin PilQ family protein [Motilimonas cestriensis]MCE2594998.1 type IV pilus secretin PilQ family protein [Motilimonas cestriensis]
MSTNKLKFNMAKLSAAILGATLFSGLSYAEPQLNKLNVNSLMAGKVELELEFSEPVLRYTDKLHYRPNQLVIDVKDASSVLKLNPVPVDKDGVELVKAERTADGLKVVIGLRQLMPYRLQHDNNKLTVRFGDVSSAKKKPTTAQQDAVVAAVSQNETTAKNAAVLAAKAALVTPAPKAVVEPPKKASQQVAKPTPAPVKVVEPVKQAKPAAKPAPAAKPTLVTQSAVKGTPKGFVNSIESIDFKRGEVGNGQLLVKLDNSTIAVDIRKRGTKLLAEFQSTHIGDDLLYVMDVLDFATPVKTVETFTANGKTRFEMDIAGDFEYRYDQLDSLFVIDVKKKERDEKKTVYQGKLISFNFQDISVRTVLQILADTNGFNLVTTDSVQGNITLRLDEVPWEQALDIILKVKGLGKRMEGNVLMVASATELAAKEKEQLESQKEVSELAPLYSEFLQINYAKAGDISRMLSSSDASLLSSRGSVSIDERTNTLLIKDTADVIDSVKRMIEILDIPVKQVLIESRMVTVTDGVQQDLGVRWGVTKATTNGSTSGSLEGTGSTSGVAGTPAAPSLADRLNVNLPVASTSAGSIAFQVAKLADGKILDLELSALESENKAEIIASPRITTANQKTAYIEQGTEIPYVESASSGATSVAFKKAVLSLNVTPHITPDNKIILDLVITQDSKGEVVATAVGQAVSIDTQEIGTQVLVDNGETIVLGGIYQQQIKDTITKVPLLGDIPWAGALFRNTIQENSKRELLIFVTPKIITQDAFSE